MDSEEKKKAIGKHAAKLVKDGTTIGLGSGSTVNWMLKELSKRVKEGLNIRGVPSSIKTEKLAQELGIPLVNFSEVSQLDISIDGADEVDAKLNLTKGGGGSLLREKVVCDAAKLRIFIVDDSKLVKKLGNFPLPVEVVPFGWENTFRKLAELGCKPVLRKIDGKTFVSNNHNYIIDCHFENIEKPAELHRQLKQLLGVVETGLFINMADQVIVGEDKGMKVFKNGGSVEKVSY